MSKHSAEFFWFITSIDTTKPNPARSRTWMFFRTEEEAIRYVQKVGQFFCESGHYNYVVVEGVDCGVLFNTHPRTTWFRLNGDEIPPTLCEKPAEFKNICNFSIG